MSAQDCCGNWLITGDYITYAISRSGIACLKLARVLDVAPGKIRVAVAERAALSGEWRRKRGVITLRYLDRTCLVRDVPNHVVVLLA